MRAGEGLKHLWGLGFRTVVKHGFTDFKSLKWYEDNVDRFLILAGLRQLNT